VQLFLHANYDFIGKRYIAYAVSLTILIAGMISLVIKGGPNFGVDFKGGVVILAKFDRQVSPGDIRSLLQNAGVPEVLVQRGEAGDEVVISTPEIQISGGKDVSDLIKETLMKPGNPWKIDEGSINIDKVSASVGKDLVYSAIKSVALGVLLILIYMWFRFELRFGVAAIIALVHDVLSVLGIFSILNEPVDLSAIAAFLTIVGYSLNDTIVVFDRIRENLKLRRGENFEKLINDSINQTLSRTVITGTTTLFTLMAIFALARVGTLHTLSLALLIGIVIGTYSSIFVASPILRGWHVRMEKAKI
jgi:preprotein translocase subunit SecF